ncbi:MAG: CPBP family intramembrane metalloprotease [Thermaerobacter sp.]|nr:CPBP family intramembrane metalloprotease [Thermaerobacter sp.]
MSTRAHHIAWEQGSALNQEWLFRGVLQTSLVRAMGTPAAITVVALVFSGLHEFDSAHPAQHPWLWLPILPLALITGIIRSRTDSMKHRCAYGI